MRYIITTILLMLLLLVSCRDNKGGTGLTAEEAYEGVSNYCHSEYDWSVAAGNPSMMYVEMSGETETEYELTFRSYTGALVCFYVEKSSGTTRMVERVPTLNIENEAGTINLHDYMQKAE